MYFQNKNVIIIIIFVAWLITFLKHFTVGRDQWFGWELHPDPNLPGVPGHGTQPKQLAAD